jgi:hypothetical protein
MTNIKYVFKQRWQKNLFLKLKEILNYLGSLFWYIWNKWYVNKGWEKIFHNFHWWLFLFIYVTC